jgi:dihydroorotate dehydrogenase (NAD+) catalytic subunit
MNSEFPVQQNEDLPGLSSRVGPLTLRTPIVAASGTFGYGTEFEGLTDFGYFGAIILKAVSIEPRIGNPYPRIVETPAGMLNCIGLENPGVDVFVREKLPEAAKLGVPLIANLVGDRVEDYVKLAGILDKEDSLVALEINASCPNVDHGLIFAVDASLLAELVGSVRKITKKPLIVKLSPNVTDIVSLAKSAMDAGADILDLGNTFLGMSICINTGKSRVSRDYAGLSGRAIRPLALRIVHQVASALHAPIIGTGGIYETSDAIEFLIAGASAVSLGTVNFIHPNRAKDICTELSMYLCRRKMGLEELVGSYKSA